MLIYDKSKADKIMNDMLMEEDKTYLYNLAHERLGYTNSQRITVNSYNSTKKSREFF